MRLDCQTPDETWINRSIFASVQMHNLTHPKQELPPMSLPSTTGPGTILLNHLLPSVNAAYQQISSACDRSEILLRMMSLDCSLQQWEVNLPRQWKLETVIDGENSCLATSSNISLASMLLAHSVAHLRLVKGLTGLGVPSLQPRAVSLVDRVCSLVSYMVNRRQGKEKSQLIGAFFAIGALYTIVQLGSLPETKRDWILELLNYIGGEGGIRKALILRNRILINWPESPGYKTVVP